MFISDKRLRAAGEDFLNSARVTGYARGTQRNYRRIIGRLVETAGNIKASDLRERHIDALFVDLRRGGDETENSWRQRAGWQKRTGRANRTLNTDRAIVRAFVEFLHRRHYLSPEFNPALSMGENAPRKKTFHIDDAILTYEEGRRTLDAAGQRHLRDRVVVALGLFAGLRESEILALRVGGVDFRQGKIKVWRDKPDEWHYVKMSVPLAKELRSWLDHLQVLYGELQSDWYVVPAKLRVLPGKYKGDFRMNQHWPMDPTRPAHGVCKDVIGAFRAAGIPKKADEGAHTLRRTAACWVLDATGDIRAVMYFLGHKQQATTELYIQYNPQAEKMDGAIAAWDPFGEAVEPEPAGNVVSLADRRRRAV